MNLPKPFSIGLGKNLEEIAEREGHNARLFHWTEEGQAGDILQDIQKARLENNEAYWESISI